MAFFGLFRHLVTPICICYNIHKGIFSVPKLTAQKRKVKINAWTLLVARRGNALSGEPKVEKVTVSFRALRQYAENLGAKVGWNPTNKTVEIQT